MFNKKDASSEIASSMESNLITHVIEKRAEQMNKFAKALDYLNSVAEIFDELGLRGEAEATTTLLEVVAAKKSKKKSKTKSKSKSKKKHRTRKSDPATKGLTSDKMENNLKEKGWVFNADDNFVEDPDALYGGNFDFEDPDNDEEHGLFEGAIPAERGRLHKDDPYAPGGVYDKVELEDWEDADDNYHYDTESDASYHIDRLDAKDHDPYEKDEKEQDLARRFHELLEQDEDSLFDKQEDLEDDDLPPPRRHRRW